MHTKMSSPFYPFLFLAIFISHTTEAAVEESVTDTNGQLLKTETDFYYILPVLRGQGGGTTITKPCPNTIILDQNKASKGLPVRFFPSVKSKYVRVSTDQNFVIAPSAIWQLGSFDETTNQSFISTCGVQGNPGRTTVSNWFKIDKFEDHYKIRFCPTVCDVCRVICRDVGVFVQGGKTSLALSNVPLKVMFQRA